MDASYYEVEDKRQRRVVVAIVALIAVVVLGITAWVIVSIVSGSEAARMADNESSEVSVDDPSLTAPKTEGVTTENVEDNTNNVDSVKSESGIANSDATVSASVSSVPATGPEDFLPLALLAGSAAAFVASRKVAKNEITA